MWKWMGIPQGWNRVRSQIVNRRGNFPGLEKRPPLLNIADPANLESEVPAIKAAAEIKKAEDLKMQKIKAIKYLAKMGCGCYDKEGKVTEALVAAMGDCTEEVRLEAVEAISETAEGEECEHCNERSCCKPDIVEQLAKLAYDLDDNGCYIEPSERVREAAQQALCVCCPHGGLPPIVDAIDNGDVEGGQDERIEGGDSLLEAPEPPPSSDPAPLPPGANAAPILSPTTQLIPAHTTQVRLEPAPLVTPPAAVATQLVSSRRRHQTAEPKTIPVAERSLKSVEAQPQIIEAALAEENLEPVPDEAPEQLAPVYKKAPVPEEMRGNVTHVDLSTGLIELHVHDEMELPLGAEVKVYHRFLSGTAMSGILQVVKTEAGAATARPLKHGRFPRVARGDQVVFSR
jgi:hypothetical protein